MLKTYNLFHRWKLQEKFTWCLHCFSIPSW